MDDYSRMSRLYLLKDRTHVSDVINHFIDEIKTQFSTFVRFCVLIMLLSILKIVFVIFVHLMVYYTRIHVHTLHNRIEHLLDVALMGTSLQDCDSTPGGVVALFQLGSTRAGNSSYIRLFVLALFVFFYCNFYLFIWLFLLLSYRLS